MPAAAVAVVLAGGTWLTVRNALDGQDLLAALNRQDPGDPGDYRALRADGGRGGIALWWCALNYASFINGLPAAGKTPTEAQAIWYGRLLTAVDRWTADGQAGVRLAALSLALRNDLVTAHAQDRLAGLRAREMPRWGESVLTVLRRAPRRSDIAVPYLAWHAANHDYFRVLALCEAMGELARTGPVCGWYAGLALLSNPATEADGLRAMHRALLAGADRYLPVTPQLRQAVETQYARLPP